jgi:hypothetical protein
VATSVASAVARRAQSQPRWSPFSIGSARQKQHQQAADDAGSSERLAHHIAIDLSDCAKEDWPRHRRDSDPSVLANGHVRASTASSRAVSSFTALTSA